MKVYTRKGDDGSTGLLYGGRIPKDAPGPDGLRRDRRSGRRARAWPVRNVRPTASSTSCSCGCSGSCSSSAPSSRPRPTTGTSSPPGTTLVTAEMVTALEPIIDDITDALRAADRVRRCPGENRVAAALDLARTIVRRAERESVTATTVGWLEPESQVVPYLNRLADLCWTLARWQEGEFRPARARAHHPLNPPTPPRRLPVPLTFSLVSTAADKVKADLLAVPGLRARRARPRRGPRGPRRVGGGLAAFMEEAGFEGKPGQTLAVPTNGALGAKAAVLVGLGAHGRADDRQRPQRRGRDRPAGQEGRSRSRRRCSTPRRTTSTRPRSRRRSPRASRSAAYQYLEYKSDAKPSKLDRGRS